MSELLIFFFSMVVITEICVLLDNPNQTNFDVLVIHSSVSIKALGGSFEF